MSLKTFNDTFSDFIFGVGTPPKYWQRYKDRLWRYWGIKPTPGLRERVLKKLHDRQRRHGKEMVRDLITRPSPLLKLLEKDDRWIGGNLVVPFSGKIPPPKTKAHHLEWK